MTENSSKKWLHSVRKRMPLVLIVVSITAMVVFLYNYLGQRQQYVKNRDSQSRWMKIIGIGIHNHHDAFNQFPSSYSLDQSGKRVASWRLLVSFQIEASKEDIIPFKMWKGDWHKLLYHQNVMYPTKNENKTEAPFSQFVCVDGEDTPFEANKNRTLRDTDEDTIMVLSTKHVYLHPYEPRDLSLDYLKELAKLDRNCELFSVDGVGFHVLFRDVEVWYLDKNMPLREILKFCTNESSKIYDREEVLGKFILE